MSAAIWGLLGGLSTIGLSELLLKLWGARPVENVWKLLAAGIALRTAWILGLLAAVLLSGVLEAKPFTLALLAGYLVSQILEGLRYQRAIRTR